MTTITPPCDDDQDKPDSFHAECTHLCAKVVHYKGMPGRPYVLIHVRFNRHSEELLPRLNASATPLTDEHNLQFFQLLPDSVFVRPYELTDDPGEQRMHVVMILPYQEAMSLSGNLTCIAIPELERPLRAIIEDVMAKHKGGKRPISRTKCVRGNMSAAYVNVSTRMHKLMPRDCLEQTVLPRDCVFVDQYAV